MTRHYELMLVLRPDFPIDDEKKREDVVAKLIQDKGKIESVKMIGKKQLAYEIKKYHEGVYLLAMIDSEVLHSSDIEKKMKQSDDVIRFLLIVK